MATTAAHLAACPLNQHGHVSACYILEGPRVVQWLPGSSIRRLMRAYSVTVRDLALRLDIPMKVIRRVRLAGATTALDVDSWTKAITGRGNTLDLLRHGG